MKVSIISYNVLFHTAVSNLPSIVSEYQPDILCLQEVKTDDASLKNISKLGYALADFSNSFVRGETIFGIATFYNKKILTHLSSYPIFLPRSIYEFFLVFFRWGNSRRTVLKTEFRNLSSQKKITIFNVHFTPAGTNGARIKQIREALEHIPHPHKTESIIVAGDFNYVPYGRKKLEEMMQDKGLQEATSSIPFTFSHYRAKQNAGFFLKIFFWLTSAEWWKEILWKQYKLDYIFYRNLQLQTVKRIDEVISDHFPIFARFKNQ